jgi:signal peptidase I
VSVVVVRGKRERHAGSIPWAVLILGCAVGLVVGVTLLAVIGPLVAMQVTGGSSLRIRNDDMAPALLPGDWVLAEALTPGTTPPRGTIVLYDDPESGWGSRAMRLMGLPGERVQIRGGALYVNGQRADMERLEDRVIPKIQPGRWMRMPKCINDPVDVQGECRQEVWRETLPDGTTGLVLNTKRRIGMASYAGRGNSDDTDVIRIPADQVFLLGDNRDSASDSRVPEHGMVPAHKLSHRVWLIHTSLDRSARFLTPRWDRFFRKVQ